MRTWFSVLCIAFGVAACARPGTVIPSEPASPALARRASTPFVSVLPSLVRIGPSAPRQASQANDEQLYASRNQTVSFQIAVSAETEPLHDVRVSLASPFTGASGRGGITVALYREHFERVSVASPVHGHPKSLGPGWYADGLIPFIDDATGKPPKPAPIRAQPVTIATGRVQPYWVDVTTTASTPPGTYAAIFSVSTDAGVSSVHAILHVWHVTMPHAPSADSDFEFFEGADETVLSEKELLRNRLQPMQVNPSAEPALMRGFGLKMAGLPFWGGASYGHCVMSPPPHVASVKRAVTRQHVSLIYDQAADEIGGCKNFESTLVPLEGRWGDNLHAGGSLNLLTQQPVVELDGTGSTPAAVDIWAMQANEYDGAAREVAKVVADGKRAWFYTALSEDTYSPKWQIDVPPGNYRIVSWIDGNLGLSGELYWAVDAYQYLAGHDPWKNVESNQGGELYAGEGVLVYPGADVGVDHVVASMRLKWLRDGMYDADLVALLKACGLGSWARAQTSKIASNFHHWTDDPKAIDHVYRTLGMRLSTSCPS